MLVVMRMILYTPLEISVDRLKGMVNPKKLLRQFNPKSCNQGFLFFFFFCNAIGLTHQKTVEMLFNLLKQHKRLIVLIVEPMMPYACALDVLFKILILLSLIKLLSFGV